MSEVIGFVGMSHSPFAVMLPPGELSDPGGRFMADAGRVRRAVAALKPDVIVVVGPDHFHGNFYDVMPPFVLGVEEAIGFGDFGSVAGSLPVASELAWSVYNGLSRNGFDIALSYSLTIDHGLVQGYEMLTGGSPIPMVPLVVNTAAPPLPALDRCAELGLALGAALRRAEVPGRVLVFASGGLSHWLPSNDPRDLPRQDSRRAALIHGRRNAQAVAADREARVRTMGGDPQARVNDEWDTWFLKQLTADELEPVVDLGHDGLEEVAGTGGHEIRGWLIGQAAVGQRLRWTSYEAVPEWITGMGIGTTFEVA